MLLYIAELAAKHIVSRHEGVLAVYLTGSAARGEATRSSDLDLCGVLRGDPVFSRQPPIVAAGRPVFYRLHPLRRYLDVEQLLRTSVVLSAQIVDSVGLYDPEGVFAKIQAAVLQRYGDPFYLKARVSLSLEVAERHLLSAHLSARQRRASQVASRLVQLVVYGLAPAVFFLADRPPTERRCLAALRPTCETLGADNLYEEIVGLLGLEEASSRWAWQAVGAVKQLSRLASSVLTRHSPQLYWMNADWLSNAMADYFIEGAKELLLDGEKEASIFCSMVIASRLLDIVNGAEASLPAGLLIDMERLGSRVLGADRVEKPAMPARLRSAGTVVEETRRLASGQL
ncbi:MAG: nucleotidyltransferase domain-containing protein [Candidatus Bathyarchaeia archaeon]